jgi:general secretion pathway protein D
MVMGHSLRWLVVTTLVAGCLGAPVLGQGVPPGMRAPAAPAVPSASGGAAQDGLRLKFSNTPLDIVLQDYSEKTGKTLLRAPALPTPTFTLRSQGDLSIDEYLNAVETVLGMHGIGLVATGGKFVRVVPIKNVRREPMEIKETLPEGLLSEDSGELISQMIVLKHIDIAEATKAVEVLRHEYGQINAFERTNSILVTDTPGNINRMLQVLRYIDQPIEAREEPSIIQIHHAKASEIKQKLEEIIAESQKEQQKSTVPQAKTSGAPGVTRSVPGVIRARATPPTDASAPPPATLIAEAERGIIRGKVKIVADERTNKLIFLTRPENMSFFEKIIAVLDIETSPDVMVKVVRLEFAEAKEIAGMLNDLIGATEDKEAPAVATKSDEGDGSEAKALRDYVKSLKDAQPATEKKSSVGELSKDNIKILSDERTNALIIMASKGDLATLLDIVDDMDMMLSQVLIEAVIIDVDLSDSLNTGVSWIQKSLTTYDKNAAGRRTPVVSFAGGGGGDTSSFGTPRDAAGVGASDLSTSGLGYFFTIFDLNINAVLQASAGDSRTKVVSTPALLTTDNTEAKLASTEKIYVFEGTTYYNSTSGTTGNNSARYRQEDIGLELTVKPHINENHIVMMEITQKISQPGDQSGATDNLAGQVISKDRTIEASIAVKSGQTIVLGGQVRDSNNRSRTKIPLLGDIPLLGRLFNSDSRSKARTETIVFITPYVLDSPEQVAEETRRRRDSLNIGGMWKQGWSGSEMAEPPEKRWWKPSPKPRAARKDLSWATSNGKSARGHEESLPAPEDIGGDGSSTSVSDVDDFLREQRAKWEQALEEAGGGTD